MSTTVDSLDALQACVGALPGPRDLKVIDFLDEHALRWIAASPLLFAACGHSGRLRVSVGGGTPGWVRARDPHRLSIPLAGLDEPDGMRAGSAFASLFLVPGLGETLRVNGRVAATDGDGALVDVHECYLHCAKALIRSAFWSAQPDVAAPVDVDSALAGSRFMVLATIDADGRADLSPKGDPAGRLLQRAGNAVWYPDRPGNRRVDSFRNILAQPRVAALALQPGSAHVVHLEGEARISTDAAMRARFSVEERMPKLVTCVDGVTLRLARSAALERARAWPASAAPAGLDPAAIFKAHVGLSRHGGWQAALARATLAIPGLMRKGLDRDYRKNLY